jgi:hypothetical protein
LGERGVPKAHRAEQGLVLAKDLHYVLETHVTANPATLPEEPQSIGQGDQVVAAETPLGEGPVDLTSNRDAL